jgi:O-antigen/teichoic acid export membrane protein
MLVLGPSRFQARTTSYIRRLVPIHFVLCSGMGAVLLLSVFVLALARPFTAATTLAGLALSAPAILFLWLMRRACYIDSRPRLAAEAGIIYPFLVLAGIVLLVRAGLLSAATTLVILGLASFLVAWWLRVRLGRSGDDSSAPISYPDVATAHWRYGRWALGSQLLGWAPGNIVVLVLPLWHSLNDAATLRVAMLLIMPVLQTVAALTGLLVPALVRARMSGHLRSTAINALIIFFGISLAYVPLVLGFGSQLSQQVFGDQYQLEGITLWLLAAILLFTAILGVVSSVLRALERPDYLMWTNVAATVVTCVVGLPLVFWWGVNGALGSVLLSVVTTLALATWGSRRLTELDSGSPGENVFLSEGPIHVSAAKRKRRHQQLQLRPVSAEMRRIGARTDH